MGVTYSYFAITERLNSATITVAKLNYSLTSSNTNFQNNSITIAAGAEQSLELELKSFNSINTKYALDYSSTNNDVIVYYVDKIEQNVQGTIGPLNSIMTIKIIIKNNTSAAATVNFSYSSVKGFKEWLNSLYILG